MVFIIEGPSKMAKNGNCLRRRKEDMSKNHETKGGWSTKLSIITGVRKGSVPKKEPMLECENRKNGIFLLWFGLKRVVYVGFGVFH